MHGIQLGKQLLAVRYGLHDVTRGREGMDGSVDELVELGVVRDEPHAYPVWLRDEEAGLTHRVGMSTLVITFLLMRSSTTMSVWALYLSGILRATTS